MVGERNVKKEDSALFYLRQVGWGSPLDHFYCFLAQMNIVGDYKVMRPVNNFLVCFVGCLGTKRRVADKALKHDCAQRPPVALTAVPLLQEDFGCNVVWRSDC